RSAVHPSNGNRRLTERPDRMKGAAQSMDAAEYKHVVLGLLFLKYVSDKFEARHTRLGELVKDEGSDYYMPTHEARQAVLGDRDEYTAEGVFWVPEGYRWADLRKAAKQTDIGQRIDAAMEAIERENPSLKGVLPKNYARRELTPATLGGLIDTFSRDDLAAAEHEGVDVLGRVYEYFLAQFASNEGKNGGEFYTPRSVVSLLVEMLRPYNGRVFDPCCGSGGMFVQAEHFVESHGGSRNDISVFGQERNPTTWRLAKMNLAIRGIEANLGAEWGDSFHNDLHPDLRADFIMANPPFNISDWGGEHLADDPRWRFGTPPPGNANYAWLQHMLHHLSPTGTMGVVLANGALTAKDCGQEAIRRNLIENDMVECIVSLPSKLFYSKALPVSLWFLTKDKSGRGRVPHRDRRGQILFVDATALGRLESRTHRVLSDDDLSAVSTTFNSWRGLAGQGSYRDVPGFCISVPTESVAAAEYNLTPIRHIRVAPERDGYDPHGALNGSLGHAIDHLERAASAYVSLSEKLQALTIDSGEDLNSFRLSEVATMIRRGITPRYCEPEDPEASRVINQKCVRDGRVSLAPSRWTQPPKRGLEERALQRFDILVNSTGVGTLGRTAQWRGRDTVAPITCDSHVSIVRPDSRMVDPTYLAIAVRLAEQEIEDMAAGSTGQTELSPSALGSLELRLPSLVTQQRIGALFAELLDQGDAAIDFGALTQELCLAYVRLVDSGQVQG
ncbi:N-6 DNA methylase, partial [Pseudoclavibacter alba]|nr:N-6 DNA methylase [Pseudoclavibacter alba]